jgi:hypothetical protein
VLKSRFLKQNFKTGKLRCSKNPAAKALMSGGNPSSTKHQKDARNRAKPQKRFKKLFTRRFRSSSPF